MSSVAKLLQVIIVIYYHVFCYPEGHLKLQFNVNKIKLIASDTE